MTSGSTDPRSVEDHIEKGSQRSVRAEYVMEWVALALAALLLLVPAATLSPRTFGDSGEYFLTAESLLNHSTPDLRTADLSTMATEVARNPINGPMRSLSAYRPGRGGAMYAQHFWAYSASTLPMRIVLRLLGGHEFKSFQLTNALMLLGAVGLCLRVRAYSMNWRLLAAGLLVCSPLALFVMLPHAEVFSVSLVVAALSCWRLGKSTWAVVAAAFATLQSQPLVLLVALLWCAAVHAAHHDRRRAVVRVSLAALPSVAPYAFNLWAFGTPSLIAEENIHGELIRPGRALEIIYDLNIGLVRSAPLTVALALFLTTWALVRGVGRLRVVSLWGVVVGVALVCSGMADWNHGTSGPSRYALWIFPLIVAVICDVGSKVRAVLALAAGYAAIVLQIAVFVAHGDYRAPSDYLEQSWGARAVLRRWPSFYAPSYEIFAERTLHVDIIGELTAPVIYVVDGRCRKALAQKRHAEVLRRVCGAEPPSFTDFRARAADENRRRNTWTYVNY